MYEPPEESPNERAKRARGKGATHAARNRPADQPEPYKVYRSAPRGLIARLRGESDAELEARADQLSREQPARESLVGGGKRGGGGAHVDEYDDGDPYGPGGGSGRPGRGGGWRSGGVGGGAGGGGGGGGAGGGGPGQGGPGRARRPRFALFGRRRGLRLRPPLHPIRLIKYAVLAVIAWLLLSAVLFFISASNDSGNLPGGAATEAALTGGSPMLFSANNVLILGLDNRPTTGYSSQEGGGANHSETDANTDSIMIWHVGGGTSRKLSIARDTLVNVPGCGEEKINAAWSCGGPKETIQVVEQLTGLKLNHLIVVDLGNFAKFINDIGGVTVKTPRICSAISGGVKDGGFTLNLSPGYHHLDGTNALTLARTRENSCNPAYNDFARQKMQQEIMNGVKSQLFSLHAFLHLPWASWDAPGVLQTDMGPIDLMQMFAAAEIGGSAPAQVLTESGQYFDVHGAEEDVEVPNAANVREKVNQLLNG